MKKVLVALLAFSFLSTPASYAETKSSELYEIYDATYNISAGLVLRYKLFNFDENTPSYKAASCIVTKTLNCLPSASEEEIRAFLTIQEACQTKYLRTEE